jgi:predicted RNase H-like HicB family nuclease
MAKYDVELERDEDGGAWLARVPSIEGLHTYGRSIEQAMNRIQEALALWVPKSVASNADLVPRLHLHADLRAALSELAAARRKAAAAQEVANVRLISTVQELTNEAGWSVRDVAKVVELSPQRVQQVKASSKKGGRRASSSRRVSASTGKKVAAARKASRKRR